MLAGPDADTEVMNCITLCYIGLAALLDILGRLETPEMISLMNE